MHGFLWEAGGRIQLRLLTYYRQRKFRQFMHGVIVAQRCLRMWLARSRYNRVLRAARTIQHALRSRAVHLLYAAWRDRRLGAVALQSAARARAARRAYLQRRGAAMLIQRAVRRGWAPEASAWEKAATAFQDMFHKLAFFREKEHERAQSLRGAAAAAGAPRDGAHLLRQLQAGAPAPARLAAASAPAAATTGALAADAPPPTPAAALGHGAGSLKFTELLARPSLLFELLGVGSRRGSGQAGEAATTLEESDEVSGP